MQRRRTLRLVGLSLIAVSVIAIVWGFALSWSATQEFDQRGWDVPARVYAAPLELYPGRRMSREQLLIEIQRLGYAAAATTTRNGSYQSSQGTVTLRTRPFTDARGAHESQQFQISFRGDSISSITDAAGERLFFAELDPLPIGSLYPSHGEDRIVLAPDEVPEMLLAGIIAVEDRRFERHIGVDLRGIARAAWVNLRSGGIEQGASTLTQQLIRSYFLNQERTFSRKIREAFMALALELRKDKPEIVVAYINEVYLGQDGARAIHGFGLAAQFFFGRPLGELNVPEIATLIGQVRGPSYYDPRRYPDRARARRDLVLQQMHNAALLSEAQLQSALQQDLGVSSRRSGGYFAAFLDVVRRQLREEYAAEDLESKGLSVFTTLDPSLQAVAEAASEAELSSLQQDRPDLEAAVVISTPHDAEIKAIIGGQQPGFNRVLDAHRPVGSLIKPAVYLAALESGSFSLASMIADAPIEITLENGQVWNPGNFNDEQHGNVTVARALAESMNMATVRLGMQVGVENVSATLERLGLHRQVPAYPSLLLGAVELTPLEIAAVYNTLASGGFSQPLRSVRAVVDEEGELLQSYRISMQQAAAPADVFALNTALIEVMRSGTGKTAQQRIPGALVTAGKSGTSDDLRDSWFAGYTAEHLAVVWIGNDENRSVGLTGATGAGRLWSSIMSRLMTRGFEQTIPQGIELDWIDLNTGLVTEPHCPQAAMLAVRSADLPLTARSCGSTRTRLGSRLRRMFDGALR